MTTSGPPSYLLPLLLTLAGVATTVVLQPFLRPLLWALLTGSVLFPFKRRLAEEAKDWLHERRAESQAATPLVLHLLLAPLLVLDRLLDRGGATVFRWWKEGLMALLLVVAGNWLWGKGVVGWTFWALKGTSLGVTEVARWMIRGDVILAIGSGWIALVWWEKMRVKEKDNDVPDADKTRDSENDTVDRSKSRIVSTLFWILLVLFGYQKVPWPLALVLGLCFFAGLKERLGEWWKSRGSAPKILSKLVEGVASPAEASRRASVVGRTPSPRVEAEDKDDGEDSGAETDVIDGSEEDVEPFLDSNKVLYGVVVACLVVQVYNHMWLVLRLLPIPVLYHGVKRASDKLGLVEYLRYHVWEPVNKFLQDNSINPPHTFLLSILSLSDKPLGSFCLSYVDPVATSVILVAVISVSVFMLVFSCAQIYLEGDHLVRVTADVINRTVSSYPELQGFLPDNWETMLGSVVDNAYVYGKEYLTNLIRDTIEEKDPEKAREIEGKVMEWVDRIYVGWNSSWVEGGDVWKGDQAIQWNEILETGKTVPLDYSDLFSYVKANLGTLMGLLDSVWSILVDNLSIAFSALFSLTSTVFGGSLSIVSSMVDIIIYFTALFYLLNLSSSTYIPVKLFLSYIPLQHAHLFTSAVEDAINGVFTASFKMAAFYGLYTYFIHSLFQVNIVFVPSIFAALFGAVPILAAYWASLPAVLELTLVQGDWVLGLVMLGLAMAPMSVVDSLIYSEIKGGGGGYLTGLAVAGGMYYFGMQGAIIGPVVLCCVVVGGRVGAGVWGKGGKF